MRHLHPKRSARTQDWPRTPPNGAPTPRKRHPPTKWVTPPKWHILYPEWCPNTPNEAPALKTGHVPPNSASRTPKGAPIPQTRSLPPIWVTRTPNDVSRRKTGRSLTLENGQKCVQNGGENGTKAYRKQSQEQNMKT
ncbi:hypothetical protein BS17DRAFT_770003 [Gyrodon lividus]|nr:hypothetical protein BS17DRAFT_770003 [Gyrodon lividus]